MGKKYKINYSSIKRHDIEYIKQYFNKFNYQLLSQEYKNNYQTNLSIRCPNGHVYEVKFKNFQYGSRCPICRINKQRNSIDKVIQVINNRGYTFISGKYVNNSSKLLIQCKNGHQFNMTFGNFNNGQNCPFCKCARINEQECRMLFEKITNCSFPSSRPLFLRFGRRNPLELDGYCQELSLAFEYDGPSHSKNLFGLKTLKEQQKRDTIKDALCKINNIYLIRIPHTIKDKETFIKNEVDLYNLVGLS